jgi:hypothetical protein
MDLKIYGASDDLVEVESSDKSLSNEWGAYDHDGCVVLSTGDRFSILFDEHGIWRIKHVEHSGKLSVTIKMAVEVEGSDDALTDTAIINGDVEWVDYWSSWPPEREEVIERIHDLLGDLSGTWLLVLHGIAKGYLAPSRR